MKWKFWGYATVMLFLASCIGEDVIDDRVPERLTLGNPISSLEVGMQYQLEVRFFDNVGRQAPAIISYASSSTQIASVDALGLVSAHAPGQTTITYSAESLDSGTLTESFTLLVSENPTMDEQPSFKVGIIRTTSSYLLQGAFELSPIEGTGDLQLTIDDTYQASTNLPGLYLYLTNNRFSIGDAYEVGPVGVFSGAHTYTIPNTGLNDYTFLLYWCKPFAVKVGEGEILNP